ncbi:MAG: hypothetical protein ACOVRM_15700, partial [Planctomycetaceae bacterium]
MLVALRCSGCRFCLWCPCPFCSQPPLPRFPRAIPMGYRNLQECLRDLEKHGQLLRISCEIDADLEAAEIHRRVCERGGPALLFENVRGCRFP